MVTKESLLQKFIFVVLSFLCCVLYTASLNCLRSEFQCSDGNCTAMKNRCDGNSTQCPDKSDETECGTRRCNEGEYRCDNGWCIPQFLVCDRYNSCPDGSDEKNCRSVERVSYGFPMGQKCSSRDKKDCGRRLCPKGYRSCDIGRCVPEMWICDGYKHCDDGSDEDDCGFEDVETIFFNEGPSVFMKVRTKAGYESTRLLSVQFSSQSIITGLSFDVGRQTLYISEAGTPAIYAVKVQGLHKRKLATDLISYPVDIAFDWTSDNVYWLDSVKGSAEVISVVNLRRSVIIQGLLNPVSIALSPNSGTMFIATTGFDASISMYGMDGRNRRVLISLLQGSPLSLAAHPSKSLLYWSNPFESKISYLNYSNSLEPRILKREISGVMSVTVNEREVLYTFDGESTSEKVPRISLPGYDKDERWKSITTGVKSPGKSECLVENGGCDYLCLTCEVGISCASCSSERTVAKIATAA